MARCRVTEADSCREPPRDDDARDATEESLVQVVVSVGVAPAILRPKVGEAAGKPDPASVKETAPVEG